MKHKKLNPQIESVIRQMAETGSPSLRWLVHILLTEIDELRAKLGIKPVEILKDNLE